MIDKDKKTFVENMMTCALIFDSAMTQEKINAYWVILQKYEINEVSQAFMQAAMSLKFFPKPAELIEFIPGAREQKHIGADEAWAIVIESMDEFATVVMTGEIMAARALVLDLWRFGDHTGARMAFRDAYNRIIAAALPPKWSISPGFDPARREDAVRKAVALGRLPKGYESKYAIKAPKSTVAGLIESANEKTGNVVTHPKFRLNALRNALASELDSRAIERDKARLAFEGNKDNILKMIEVGNRE